MKLNIRLKDALLSLLTAATFSFFILTSRHEFTYALKDFIPFIFSARFMTGLALHLLASAALYVMIKPGETRLFHIIVSAAALLCSIPLSYYRYISAAGSLLHAISLAASAYAFLSTSVAPYLKEKTEKSYLPHVFFAAAGLFFISAVRVLSYQSAFHSRSFDSGLYVNTIWLISQGYPNFTHVGYLGLAHDFGMHFEPFIFLLAGLYKFVQQPWFLFTLQPLFVFAAMVPLYLLAEKLLQDKQAAFLMALAFGISPYLSMLPDSDFHPLAFYPFFFLMFFYFAESGRLLPAVIFSLLAASVKEETLIYASAACLFLFINKKNAAYAAMSVFYLLAGAAAIIFIIPAYSPFDFTMGGALLGVVKEPARLLNVEYPGQLLAASAAVLFLCYASLLPLLLIMLPPLIVHSLNYQPSWQLHLFNYHYAGAVIPAFFISAIYAARKYTSSRNFTGAMFFILCAGIFLNFGFSPAYKRGLLREWVILAFVLIPLAYRFAGGKPGCAVNFVLPLLVIFTFYSGYFHYNKYRGSTPGERKSALKEALKLAPADRDAYVIATDNLVPHLTSRRYLISVCPWRFDTTPELKIQPALRVKAKEIYLFRETKGDEYVNFWTLPQEIKDSDKIIALLEKHGYSKKLLLKNDYAEVWRFEIKKGQTLKADVP